MKINLNESEFLSGKIRIRVSNNEQSKLLINLARENGFDIGNTNDSFEIDTWILYPWYFIEDDWQLQACDTKMNAYCDVEEIADFEDWFDLVEDK